ncbi:MAG: DinB family protein [Pirellulales bacterium]|nr:DinB family protein [Pirellulales bacterium]
MKTFVQKSCCALVVLAGSLACSAVHADRGQPVAIRHLPGGGFAIESMWNLSVVISGAETFESSDALGVDIVVAGSRAKAKQPAHRFLIDTAQDADAGGDHVLDRAPNQPKASWRPADQASDQTGNAIRVRTLSPTVFAVDVDGVRLVYVSKLADKLDVEAVKKDVPCDVLIVGTGSGNGDGSAAAKQLAQQLGARLVITSAGQEDVERNTVAVRASEPGQKASLQIIALSRKPVELAEELAALMDRKEAACADSQKVFAKLSTDQMNFRPSNGTHTPRWNAEHMMGRELGFFSQIYAALDDSIPAMNLNPKQMPADYVARHADWSGEEEARQMERVTAFTRRFAYLLKDLPLDQKAPGSFWTPRRLLLQMERHYGEHTANVKKKFELEDWPQQ